MQFAAAITALTVKAVCVTQGELDCGMIQTIYANGREVGEGLVTHKGPSEVLSSETGLTAYTIPKEDFYKIWDSGLFEFEITFVLPNEPVDPKQCEVGANFEFVTRVQL